MYRYTYAQDAIWIPIDKNYCSFIDNTNIDTGWAYDNLN